MLHLPARRVPAYYFGIPLYGRLVSSSPLISLFSHLVISAWTMGIYFMLWAIMQYVFILLRRLFQLWLLGPFSVGSCVLLTYPHCCAPSPLFKHILTFWHYKMAIFLPSRRSSHFFKELCFPYWRVVLETKDWYAHCY